MESYEEAKRDGVKYWDARLFVPRKPLRLLGSSWFRKPTPIDPIDDRHLRDPLFDLTQDDPQFMLDAAMKDGYSFCLDIETLVSDSLKLRTDGRFGFLDVLKTISVKDAVSFFNEMAKSHINGRQQPELTVEEMIAAFQLWIASNECNEATRKDLQQALDSQMLRPGHQLQFNTQSETDGHIFDVWSIQFVDDESPAWFKIRDTTLLSRPKTEEERKAWEQRIDQMKESFRDFKRGTNASKVDDTSPEGDKPADAAKDSGVNLPPMEFDTLEDFMKPGKDMFDSEMKQIDERLATAVEGSAEHSLFSTKKKQLQQQWNLGVAQLNDMAAAANAGKPVQFAPLVIPNIERPWQAPMPDPLLGHDEDIAKVLAGTWQVNRYVEDGEEPPLPFEGSTVTFSKNMIVMHLKAGDDEAEIQYVYRIGNDKIDIWYYDPDEQMQDTYPFLGSFSIDNNTLRICCHITEMEQEVPQSRPPVRPGKGFLYWELQRDRMVEKAEVPKGETDDLHAGQSYKIKLLVLASDDLKPVPGATVEVTLIRDDSGVTGDGGFAGFKTDEDGIAIVDKSLWPGRYQINVRASEGSRYRDTEFAKEESILIVHKDGRYSPREFRLAVDEEPRSDKLPAMPSLESLHGRWRIDTFIESGKSTIANRRLVDPENELAGLSDKISHEELLAGPWIMEIENNNLSLRHHQPILI